ncbi:MAG: hypothetical protein FJ009_11840 [Chloroflexi bacterium]|nr:hypothetical protein [Chloroflexota bacterium]
MLQVSGNGHKRAVLYARVSTDDQKDKGYSLPSQFDAMRKYAAQNGFEIVGEFQEDFSGATPIEYRPEGGKAYAMLQSGDADVIIAYRIDRYVRPPEDGDEWDLPVLIRGLAKLGKEIHVCNRGKLGTSFADLLIAMLDAKKAGEERRDFRERSMRGKRAKVKTGKVVIGRPPYGYRLIRDEDGKTITFEIDEPTARIVRLIYRWYVDGDEHGERLSIHAIARRLSEMKTPVPSELQRGYEKVRKRGAGMWSRMTVISILRNEVYAGVWRYGVKVGATHTRRPIDESVSANVPAIIDRETWKRAQAQRAHNKTLSPRNVKNEYLLRGLIRCGLCNTLYIGTFSIGKKPGINDRGRRYYRDDWVGDHHVHLEGRCPNKYIRADAIEADVWDEIKGLFQDHDKLRAELKAAQQNANEQLKSIRDKLQITDDFIKHFQGEAAKIASAWPDTEKGGTVQKLMKEKERQVNARLDELARQRAKHIKEIEMGSVTDERIETIMTFARRVRRGISKAENNSKAKRRIIDALGVSVIVTPGKYHLKCIVGEKDGEIRKLKYGGGMAIVSNPRSLTCL